MFEYTLVVAVKSIWDCRNDLYIMGEECKLVYHVYKLKGRLRALWRYIKNKLSNSTSKDGGTMNGWGTAKKKNKSSSLNDNTKRSYGRYGKGLVKHGWKKGHVTKIQQKSIVKGVTGDEPVDNTYNFQQAVQGAKTTVLRDTPKSYSELKENCDQARAWLKKPVSTYGRDKLSSDASGQHWSRSEVKSESSSTEVISGKDFEEISSVLRRTFDVSNKELVKVLDKHGYKASDLSLDSKTGALEPEIVTVKDYSKDEGVTYIKCQLSDGSKKYLHFKWDDNSDEAFIKWGTQVLELFNQDGDVYTQVYPPLIKYDIASVVKPNDDAFFSELEPVMKKINKHPCVEILSTFEDTAGNLTDRFMLLIHTSTKQEPTTGSSIIKTYAHSNNKSQAAIYHNMNKPHSEVHSVRTLSIEDSEAITKEDVFSPPNPDLDLIAFRSTSRYIKHKLGTVGEVFCEDPKTGSAYKFICFGGYAKLFLNNPELKKVFTIPDMKMSFFRYLIKNHSSNFDLHNYSTVKALEASWLEDEDAVDSETDAGVLDSETDVGDLV